MNQREHIQFAAYCLIAVLVTFLLHEFTHWLTGEELGYQMRMSLNRAWPESEKYNDSADYMWISLSGPLFTLAQMTIFSLVMVRILNDFRLFPFVFTPFYMTVLAAIMNIFQLNDLGRVSRYLGMGVAVLPLLFVFAEFMLLYWVVGKCRLSRKSVLVTTFWCMLFSSLLILADQTFKITLI